MATKESKQVLRRRVFYIPGYDPIHPRRYREMYRREGAEQALISDYEISLTPKTTKGPYGWHVHGVMDGKETTTDFEVLVWSDIVRDSMSNSIPATYAQLLRTAWIYISTGTLFRLMRLRKGPVIAALYPVAMLILQLSVAVLIGWGIAKFVDLFSGALGSGVSETLIRLGAFLIGLIAVVVVLRWFRARDNRLMAYYLMHDYAYSARLRGAIPPELDARLAEFGDQIADALCQDEDEVLVVGHSSGAHLAVTVLADLIRAGKVPKDGPALGFLSLGQVVPMVSFLPLADQLRGDLQYLSARDELTWVDVSAPGDGCAFALCDPVTVSGVAPADKKWPLVFSAAFTQTLSPERWNELKRRYFRLHFQYLCAFDRPKDYDYFRITAGPKTLAARYDGRSPSRSRIDKAVSKYTSVRAL
ncbi:MAG: hypothetical protein JKY94_14565 [Rhodobacteraceae bacterium]|nr:hypothetical protein [Paracoccaceae bacterium]